MDQLVEHFDIHDVLGNPARFDIKKAEAINGTHVRMLDADDFRDRLVPYLQRRRPGGGEPHGPRGGDPHRGRAAGPGAHHAAGRGAGDARPSCSRPTTRIDVADDARKGLPENLTEVLDAALAALEPVADWTAENIQAALKEALVEGLGVKPRLAFGPVRTAVSGPPDLPAAVRIHGHPGQGLLAGPPPRLPRLTMLAAAGLARRRCPRGPVRHR